MTRKIFFGWKADKNKVKSGMLCCYVNGVIKSYFHSKLLSTGGILIFREEHVCFDDEVDKVEFLFDKGELPDKVDERELPDWVEPLVLDAKDTQRIPKRFDLYTIECVRDLIYWWFEVYCHKKLSKERKDRIAKIAGLNYHKKRYGKFIDYGFNHPEYLKWLKKEYEKRHKDD